MGCCCCGGPSVASNTPGHATSVKYDATTGDVVWWIDSELANNAGGWHNGVYYELSAPSSTAARILRAIDPVNGAEIARKSIGTMGNLPLAVTSAGGNLYAILQARVHKINTSNLTTDWQVSLPGSAVVHLVSGDYAIISTGSPIVYRLYTAGSLTWEIDFDDPNPGSGSGINGFHCIDSSGYFVAAGGTGGEALWRYDGSGTLVDAYTPSVGTSPSGQAAVADGSDIWVGFDIGASGKRLVRLDSSLAEQFTPVAMGSTLSNAIKPMTVFSGTLYAANSRYVYKVTSGGTATELLDTPVLTSITDVVFVNSGSDFWRGDFAATPVLRLYDATTTPATLDATLSPTLLPPLGTARPAGRTITADSSHNAYVSGTRAVADTIDKTG